MLIDNINLIKAKLPAFWNELVQHKEQYETSNSGFSVEQAKNGLPILTYNAEGRKLYCNSKYNPAEEAELFLQKYEDVEEYGHFFFYGLGLGYHIEALMNKYPDKLFTIYEPNPAVIYTYLEYKQFGELPLRMLKNIFVEWNPSLSAHYLQQFVAVYNEKTLLVMNTSYERLFPERVKDFNNRFTEAISAQRGNLGINHNFERFWTMNSLLNFKKVLETNNVVSEKLDVFKGKPVLLVAAGPSLADEIENLRTIKEQGLAYIVSVGSANKVLIKNGIYPDAVTSYDPLTGFDGLDVFSEITEQNITTIPLIFGSSVGYKAVAKYTGPMLHMLINQDTISPYYLGQQHTHQSNSMISDAPSIAAVTTQLLQRLGSNPIILVGQNFAYRNNEYYAEGIGYEARPTLLSNEDKQGMLEVEDVEGNKVYTFEGFTQAKVTMEQYIRNCPSIEVINTTRGGARIEGTTYLTLDTIIDNRLQERIVEAEWYRMEPTEYDRGFVRKQARLMEKEFIEIGKIMDRMIAQLKALERLSKFNDDKDIDQHLKQFDKHFLKFKANKYYTVFLQPMVRNQHQFLLRAVSDIRITVEPLSRAKKVVEVFGKFIFECQKEMKLIHYDFSNLQQYLMKLDQDVSQLTAN